MFGRRQTFYTKKVDIEVHVSKVTKNIISLIDACTYKTHVYQHSISTRVENHTLEKTVSEERFKTL